MSVLIVVSAISIIALIAALPGDWARRGGSGNVVAFGGIANAVLPGLCFWAGSHFGVIHGVAGFAGVVAAMIVGNVFADRIATHVWGTVAHD
jgi:hypothetical protein